MALIKCSECGAEVSDKAVHCPKCGAPITVGGNENLIINQVAPTQPESEPEFVQKRKKSSKRMWQLLAAFWIVFGVLCVVLSAIDGVERDSGPRYYIAQIPSEIGNASFEWTGVIDGYIHKDKECCQSVVSYWNSLESSGVDLTAEVVKISPDSTAYRNRMGQSVSYEVALSYCPLCRGW